MGIIFEQFHRFASLPRNFASYLVTLIPKVNYPLTFGDFKTISLVGSLYKLVAKVLAIRLWDVMEKLISPNKSALLKRRMLVEGVVATNKCVDLAKRSKSPCLIF